MKFTKKKVFGLLLLVSIIFINYKFNQHSVFTVDNLKYYRNFLINFVDRYWVLSIVSYISIYILVITIALPGVAVMTLAGGVLFPFKYAFALIMFASIIGALINFITGRYFLQDFFKRTFNKSINKINKKIEGGAFSNLIILRFIPIFPYAVVNFAFAISDISMIKFLVVTMIGKMPGTLILVYAGLNLAEVDNSNDFHSPKMILAIFLLVLFIILPILYNYTSKRKKSNQ